MDRRKCTRNFTGNESYVLQWNFVRAFQNDLGQRHEICSFGVTFCFEVTADASQIWKDV